MQLMPRIPGKWYPEEAWTADMERNIKKHSNYVATEDSYFSDQENFPIEFSEQQAAAIRNAFNSVVHGDKSWTESPDFNKLLGELEKKQSENKPVTKEEIDWLVEQLANMQAFNPAGYLSLPIVDQL